jgi:PAS domain S-box-containing protein
MRLKLSHRFNLYIGCILLLGFLAHTYHNIRSGERVVEEVGMAEAEGFSRAIFDQLYASMKLGAGAADNRAVIDRFDDIKTIDEIRIIHGPVLDRQYGVEEDEIARDEFEAAALAGSPIRMIEASGHGYRVARFILPVLLEKECLRCHEGGVGEVSGAISVRISLKNYEYVMAAHKGNILFWGGAIIFLSSAAILVTVRKRFLNPLFRIKEGADAIAGGDLGFRVGLRTNDELEDLGRAFDTMAESLFVTTSNLSELSEKHSKLVQMAADAIVLKDIETRGFVDANPAAEELSGYTRGELMEKRAADLYPPEKFDEYERVFTRWIYDGKGFLQDAAIIRKDGSIVPVDIAASVLEIRGRRYIQEIWRDASERKGLEEALRKQIGQLEAAVKARTIQLDGSLSELEAAYKKLKNSEQRLIESAKLVSLGEMGAGIAHELNSPIAGVLSITEALMRRFKADEHTYFMLQKIKDAAVRSKYIILDMLAYARPFNDELTPIYVNETIRATLTIFASEIKSGSIDIIEAFDPELPRVLGNRGQLMEVFLNIIKNARDAMDGSGTIFITTGIVNVGSADFVVVGIRDTGGGIPDEIKDRIFDPFFSTKEKGGGLNIGLGLSISRSIVREHGGRIEVESRGGTEFRVMLPVATGAGSTGKGGGPASPDQTE